MKEILLFEDVFGLFGGIEKVISDIVADADEKEFHLSLYANHFISDEYLPFLNQHHVKVYQARNEYVENPAKRHLKGYRLFKTFLRNNKFDVIHFNVSNSIDLKYPRIAKHVGIKNIIVHCHNDDATSRLKRMAHKVIKPFRRNCANYYLACSPKAGKWLYNRRILESKNYFTLPNGINIQEFRFSESFRRSHRPEFTLDEMTLLVMHVGRFNKQKNQIKALTVFSEVHKKNPNSKLVFFGTGDNLLISTLKRKATELGLDDCVQIHKPISNINEYYNCFDCFLFPSLYEGFGLVFLEAQRNGLPCVVSDTVPEIARVSPLVTYHPLDEKDDRWAKDVLSCKAQNHPNLSDVVDTSSIDVHRQVKLILDLYRKN